MTISERDFIHYANSLDAINKLAGNSPGDFVEQTERKYHSDLEHMADHIIAQRQNCKVIMLAGPSGSGKTTTAHLLADAVGRLGIHAVIVSLDDFYKGESNAPVLKNGQHDYESIDAIDVPRLKSCLLDLTTKNECDMPVFDFEVHQPFDYTRHVVLGEHDVAILEGLHALNPTISENLPQDRLLKVYISVKQGIVKNGEELLSPNDMRLVRRLVRDFNFRHSAPERTLSMWNNVMEGEFKYIKPFRPNADMVINSFHAYESCVLAPVAVKLLKAVEPDSAYYRWSQSLADVLRCFDPIESALVPHNSILREFIGGGKYC